MDWPFLYFLVRSYGEAVLPPDIETPVFTPRVKVLVVWHFVHDAFEIFPSLVAASTECTVSASQAEHDISSVSPTWYFC
jgi:hypothetical protein